MRLNIKGFALSMGITYGFLLFIGTWWLLALGKCQQGEVFLSKMYPFYTLSPLGSLLGLVYGFIDGLILGSFFAWLYNQLSHKSKNNQEIGNGN